jgi:DNA-binding NtrC family response regulator
MDFPAVLCIDDRLPVLELRKVTLEPQGYCVHIASSGHTAMKMLSETSMAAVLLEYRLEGIESEAVASDIKQRFPDLPLILLSAYFDMPERILWLVVEYLMKSALPERLVWVIERASRPCHAAATSRVVHPDDPMTNPLKSRRMLKSTVHFLGPDYSIEFFRCYGTVLSPLLQRTAGIRDSKAR